MKIQLCLFDLQLDQSTKGPLMGSPQTPQILWPSAEALELFGPTLGQDVHQAKLPVPGGRHSQLPISGPQAALTYSLDLFEVAGLKGGTELMREYMAVANNGS